MKTQTALDFVVIDDDTMNNRICEIVIMRKFPESDIQTFTDPVRGIDYIADTYSLPDANNVILFLDLKMPVVNGWQVLDKIGALSQVIRDRMNIYILSSSTDDRDVIKANKNPLVKKFIRKPLLINTLSQQISNTDFLQAI